MNRLSWLLYLGDVLGSLRPLFIIVGLCFVVVIVGVAISIPDEDDRLRAKAAWKTMPFYGAICFVFWLLAALCPSTETVYAIAASEMGQQALQTPTATKTFKALDAWLDKQITPAETK